MKTQISKGCGVGRLKLVRPTAGLTPTRAFLQVGQTLVRCVIGAGGVSRNKREGDGATPAGRLRILAGRFRADRGRRLHCAAGLQPLRQDDGWCDDPSTFLYNRPVRLPQRVRCEAMTMTTRAYDYVFVLDYNLAPRSLGRGSAIFFHLASPDWTPTAGCVAISPDAMRRIIPRLKTQAIINVS